MPYSLLQILCHITLIMSEANMLIKLTQKISYSSLIHDPIILPDERSNIVFSISGWTASDVTSDNRWSINSLIERCHGSSYMYNNLHGINIHIVLIAN